MDSSATNQKISWFRKEEIAGNLILKPDFQRRPVWTEEQASYLIDTILNGLPIPEIYLRSSSSPAGESRYEVVDGQQRIRSVLLFGSNDLELSGDGVGAKWFEKRFEDLSDDEKAAFWDYKIVVRDVAGASDLEIRDLFKRLNIHSVVLNDQELRHARYSGHFIQAMETLADDEWWLDSSIVSLRQIRRMEDVEYISELFVGLTAGPQDKKKTLNTYYGNFDAAMPQRAEWVERFEQVRDFVKSLLPRGDLRLWSGKSDFYTLFLALAPLAERKPRLTAAEKAALRAELSAFRSQVDQAKRKDNKKKFTTDVEDYVEAVTRAATDQGRRETRLRILEERLQRSLLTASKDSPTTKKVSK
ncbi:MAG: DUF262 domain-containing protein [Bryobacteraceae bacterium]|jgi:ribosome-binding protein aMBF1 (putative translation factor)